MEGVELPALRGTKAFAQVVGSSNLACPTPLELILHHHILKPRFNHRLAGQLSLVSDQGLRRKQGELGIIGAPGGSGVEVGDEPVGLPICLHPGCIPKTVSYCEPNQGPYSLLPHQRPVGHQC
ncbi:hypothetical protein SDC9_194027 [bioreactor metagenome]|uniref:Uncharacterized protein n=1 Tax=bioreactor metagenome TaxID=1076179 RepID=A0A645I564_9ZZZZ